MSAVKGLLKGDKFNGRHQTIIEGAHRFVCYAKESKHVTKIHIGLIKPIGTGAMRLKFVPISGGLKVQFRGKTAVQIFILYTTEPQIVEEEIRTKWETS